MLQGALAEMRTLLLELRPSSLLDQTLGQLLELLAEAARARSGAIVTLNVEGECPLPEDVTIALHRIAQESLNNVAKHAEASEINVRLICDPERLCCILPTMDAVLILKPFHPDTWVSVSCASEPRKSGPRSKLIAGPVTGPSLSSPGPTRPDLFSEKWMPMSEI